MRIRGNLSKLERKVIVDLVTTDVHARDIIDELYENKARRRATAVTESVMEVVSVVRTHVLVSWNAVWLERQPNFKQDRYESYWDASGNHIPFLATL